MLVFEVPKKINNSILTKKLAKKWFECRRWSIQSNNIGLQQGNGLGMDDVNMEMD
jgi:hypothetical protein